MGKKHTALFQTHNLEKSSFFSTLIRVFAPLFANTWQGGHDVPPSGPSRVKEGAAFHWKISSPTDMCILKLDLKMEVRLADISSLLDFQKLQTCCLVTIYCPFLHRFWPANLVESESVYNEMLHLWINCFRRLVMSIFSEHACFTCFQQRSWFSLNFEPADIFLI